MLELNLMVVADAANISNSGSLNLLGEFNTLISEEAPFALVGKVLVVRFQGTPNDVGQHVLGFRLLDPDRGLIWASPDTAVQYPPSPMPGIPARLQGIVALPNFVLPAAGTYEVEILLDGAVRGCLSLHAVLRRDMRGFAQP